MKLLALPLLLSLLISVCFANTDNNADLVQCLKTNSQPSNPIADAIFTPDSSNFTSVLTSYIRNLRFSSPETPKPVAIVTAKHESHVQAAVICCKKLGLQMRIRSGGHDYDGLSYVSTVPFVILDMNNLRAIDINVAEETATAQAGAILGELYYTIANKSNVHAFPAGVCPGLGLGGHFSGGGYGNLLRKFGLSVDHIIDAQIVDVNGKILDRKAMGEDLFWAIRGGGAASFGVILSWKIKLVRVPEKVTGFTLVKNIEQGATDLTYKYQQIADKLDEDLFIRLILTPANGSLPGQKTVNASFTALFLGDSNRLLTIMSKSFPELDVQKKDCIEMRWIESTLYYLGMPPGSVPLETLLNRVPKNSVYLKRKSDYVKQVISKPDLEAMWKVMIETEVSMQWNPYGGKMAEIPETATPFPHRAGILFLAQYNYNWNDAKDTEKSLKAVRSLYDFMAPHVSKNPREHFFNYRDIEIGSIGAAGNGTFQDASVYGTQYFKGNFERLVKIKTAVDPDNFFRYEQSIPTQASVSRKTTK